MRDSRRTSKRRTLLLLGLVIVLAFASVFGVALFHEARAVSDDTYEYLEIFNQTLSIVQRDYVKEVSTKDLIYGAIEGMLSSLDPHTVFMPRDDYEGMREDISGEFGGLGIEIGIRGGKLLILNPIEDTPAWRAGFQSGDWISHIEGESTQGMKIREAVHRMRGPVGTEVTITVVREGEEPKDYTIVRELIHIQSVKEAKLYPGKIGYLKMSTFTESTAKEIRSALKKITDESDGKLNGLVLDLRNNPGGPLDQAIRVADLFVPSGVIVTVKGRGDKSSPAYAHKAGTIEDLPLVVLINQYSASASEIVAGAVQDQARAVVIGVNSFGKGSVQQLRTLKDGSGLKITTAHYHVPSGRIIQEKGIHPDVEVFELSPRQIEEKLAAGEEVERRYYRERDLQRRFHHQEPEDPEEEGEETPTPEPEKLSGDESRLPPTVGDDTDDYQLQRALDLIRSPKHHQAILKEKVR